MNDLISAVDLAFAVPITEERPWAAFAICKDRDPDAFFPATVDGERDAMRVCHGCPVQIDCLEFAMEAHIRFGVWGGMTEKQRQLLRRQSR